MHDPDCVGFLQWALPRLRLRWPGYRKVRGQVCKRLGRRLHDLGLPTIAAYRDFLEEHDDEWAALDALCRVTISRFYRDRAIFEELERDLLPAIAAAARARADTTVHAWSIGCASGEEAYTLALVWRLRVEPELRLRVLATDVDDRLLERARAACYAPGSLRELPADLRARGFTPSGSLHCVRAEIRADVELRRHDIRAQLPDESFDLLLCRYLAFTYFDEALQAETLARLTDRLRPGGALVIGRHESLPAGARLRPWGRSGSIYRA